MEKKTERPVRFWYEYRGEKNMVPQQFVYKIHESMGGGYDIAEDFFTWAFNKHGISITDINIIYSSSEREKTDKNVTAASNTFFVAVVKGKDKYGIEKCGDGEVGSESITNFQRKFPAGLAIKRAKVNMGKEFFGLTNLKMATDCRDYKLGFGQYKDVKIEELASTKEGINTLKWIASDDFNGDPILKYKVQEFIEKYLSQKNPINEKQKEKLKRIKEEKGMDTIKRVAEQLGISLQNLTEKEAEQLIKELEK